MDNPRLGHRLEYYAMHPIIRDVILDIAHGYYGAALFRHLCDWPWFPGSGHPNDISRASDRAIAHFYRRYEREIIATARQNAYSSQEDAQATHLRMLRHQEEERARHQESSWSGE